MLFYDVKNNISSICCISCVMRLCLGTPKLRNVFFVAFVILVFSTVPDCLSNVAFYSSGHADAAVVQRMLRVIIAVHMEL